MAESKELPDPEQLDELFRQLIGPEQERDDAAAEVLLEMHGIDPAKLDDDLRERLEREVAERRERGEEVPQGMLDAIASLQNKPEPEDEAPLEPKDWIEKLLSGIPPNNLAGSSQSTHLQSFRSRNLEPLSKEDRQILESLATQLRLEIEEEGDG
jgi:hypothetical protein